ncbi:lactonase family protein [Ralstonia pseudosolanacearum]|uniref:lactonase family protein n=1 Tax=Ralstonia pseudosolanacearum TaxID=1310165 RepID=UPI003CF32FAD
MVSTHSYALAAVGTQLHALHLAPARDRDRHRYRLDLTLPIQYAAAHPERPLLYAGCSNGGPGGRVGDTHCVALIRADTSGSLEVVQGEMPLPHRPIHVAVEPAGRYLAIAFAQPAGIQRYALDHRGDIGRLLDTVSPPGVGVFPHSTHFSTQGSSVIVCARGNDEREGFAEDPGTLDTFIVENGRLKPVAQTRYGPGLGPRDVAEHPTHPWLYVALERGNSVALHGMDKGIPSEHAANVWTTLRTAPARRQRVGTVRVHPSGRWLFVVNRADAIQCVGGIRKLECGVNEIVVYEIEATGGNLVEVQRLDAGGIEPRTLSVSDNGRYLVVGNQISAHRTQAGALTDSPASLLVFEIQPDGMLEPCWSMQFPDQALIWSGIIAMHGPSETFL